MRRGPPRQRHSPPPAAMEPRTQARRRPEAEPTGAGLAVTEVPERGAGPLGLLKPRGTPPAPLWPLHRGGSVPPSVSGCPRTPHLRPPFPCAPSLRGPWPRRPLLPTGEGGHISEVWTSSLLGLEMDSRKLFPQGKKLESHLSQEHRRSPLGLTAAWGQPSIQSSAQQGLQTQDWVCEPPERRRPGRHWSVSIDERRRLAMLGGRERPGAAGAPLRCRDIVQMVAQLVSEDVDKDVLFPHPLRSTESTNAFQAFLARSAPFWHNATFEARASRSPPS
ncbi:testis-expressed protein 22 isoform X3 [Symphalangus syndactylus]|uniref:testis-expressed protein 22 isoform X3 n=2 Tax=Symphalangus syndactylus TaxID=9590 RepID=UPI0024421C51|nr:testis-expressed protein 22 isoform X2 [Symphalangus syndactylus]